MDQVTAQTRPEIVAARPTSPPWQRLNALAGFILLVYAAAQLLADAFGLAGPAAMDAAEGWRRAVLGSRPAAILVAAALLLHVVHAVLRTGRRATLRMPGADRLGLATGFAIPVLLLPYLVDTAWAQRALGVEAGALDRLARLWPDSPLALAGLVLVVWIHGCLGLDARLRFGRAYRAARPVLVVLAVALPGAALAGLAVSGRAVATLIEDPVMRERVGVLTNAPSEMESEWLDRLRFRARLAGLGLVALAGAGLAAGALRRRGAKRIAIHYAGGPKLEVAPGPTLLEMSRIGGVPHAGACDGRAACGECRVRVDAGEGSLPPPSRSERATLGSLAAAAGVRLACRIRPVDPLAVTRLVPPPGAHQAAEDDLADAAGVERRLAVLAVLVPGLAALARERLAEDVVFILDALVTAIRDCVEAEGGWVAASQAQQLVVLFGREETPDACRRALRAAVAVDCALERVNARFQVGLGRPLVVTMGVETGPVVLGRVGRGAGGLTAIGAPVETAWALAQVGRTRNLQLVASPEAARAGGWKAAPGGDGGAFGLARARDLDLGEGSPA